MERNWRRLKSRMEWEIALENDVPANTFTTALPVLFAHCALIDEKACVMSIIGGWLIYGTIISFTMFFQETEEF
jgi:hypothetical protein